MKRIISLVLMCICLTGCSIGTWEVDKGYVQLPSAENSYEEPKEQRVEEQDLSDEYDIVLCEGQDTEENTYALVAKQRETSLGYEITAGVIKNNAWAYPMSADFRSLEKMGCFMLVQQRCGETPEAI